jgi:hypothetical protein
MRQISRGLAAAVLAALAAAGCATLEPAPLPGEVRIVAVDRRGWDMPEERNLFRLHFDATRARAILRQAANLSDTRYEGDLRSAEIAALEQDAERELKATGKCGGLAKLAVPVDPGDGSAGVVAVFKCTTSIF